MSAHDIVLCQPVRTAIGAYNGSLKGTPATELGAIVVRETLKRAGLDGAEIGAVVMGNVVQAGNKMNPARQAGDRWRRARRGSGHDREPRLRLRRAGDRLGRAGDRRGRVRSRGRGRHGEHGPRALPHGRRALGLPHGPGRRSSTRC